MSDSKRPITDGYLPAFHSAQIEIADDQARYKVVAAGRRFGKGILGIAAAFRYASRGGKARWIAPSYASDSYQSGWNWAKELAGQIPGVDVHLQRREINFSDVGGGWLQFKTAEEPDSLRGEGIDFVVFDEAAHIDGLETMWEQCVRPSLMDRRGDAWFISTPNGFNYFNDLFLRSRDQQDWSSFQFATSANPHIDYDEIAELRKTLPALVARQEIDAEFVQLAGALFKRQNIRILEDEPIGAPWGQGAQWVRSWDLAFTEKTTSDWTAGIKMCLSQDGTVIISDIVSGQMEWPDAVRCIANTAIMDGRSVRQGIECVSAQVGVLQTLLRDPLLLAHTFIPIEVHRDKLTRALPLVARSEQGKLAIVRGSWNQKFLDELCAFPEGLHDDQVDACSGGMTLLATPTGAIDDVSKIRVGGNNTVNKYRPQFTPRRLQTA
jgi:predicted phage terminase large subunit-like protein